MKNITESSKNKPPYISKKYVNLWGYPVANRRIQEYAAKHKATIIMTYKELRHTAKSDVPKIMIAGFGLLVYADIQLLGFVLVANQWHRCSFPKVLEPNRGRISIPTTSRLPDTAKEYWSAVCDPASKLSRYHSNENLMTRILRNGNDHDKC